MIYKLNNDLLWYCKLFCFEAAGPIDNGVGLGIDNGVGFDHGLGGRYWLYHLVVVLFWINGYGLVYDANSSNVPFKIVSHWRKIWWWVFCGIWALFVRAALFLRASGIGCDITDAGRVGSVDGRVVVVCR